MSAKHKHDDEPDHKATKAHKPKFKVGDAVAVKDKGEGEVVEVGEHDEHWFSSGCHQLYSVKLTPWTAEPYKDANGNPAVRYRHPEDKAGEEARYRAHEADVLGGVPETHLGK